MNDLSLFLSPKDHPWMREKGLLTLQGILQSAGGEVRVVGGAVRDALVGRSVQDIDLATTLPPEAVMKALRGAGIKVVPIGLSHGTVTAVIKGKGYEITTLRRDILTDGRHAKVVFTDDWREDAARRDFTFNALYLKESGEIVDYFNGRDDLVLRCVRFIGDPEQRIDEDALRILRAFRFVAQLSFLDNKAYLDDAALTACGRKAPLLLGLSAERLWKDMAALLCAEEPVLALQSMITTGVLEQILPEGKNTAKLERLIQLEQSVGWPSGAILRLAALLDHGAAASVAQRFRLSNREREALLTLESLALTLIAPLSSFDLRQRLYEEDAKAVQGALLLAAAEGQAHDLSALWPLCVSWCKPAFPLRGRDLLKQGNASGQRIGEALKATEAWWRSQDFAPDHQACLHKAMTFFQDEDKPV